MPACGGDDASEGRPDIQTRDEVQEQTGGVSHRLDYGELTPTQCTGGCGHGIEVSMS